MFTATTKVRVRYGETDQMGYCYYGNYATYHEVARVEALRSLGVSYKELEEEGIMLPVVDYSVKYKRPAYYDDELTIVTSIKELPTSRIKFEYEIYNEKQELINTGNTTLFFMRKADNKPIACPHKLLVALKEHLQ